MKSCQPNKTKNENAKENSHETTEFAENSKIPSQEATKLAETNEFDENEWQILEGLKDGHRFEEKPPKFSGYLYKRRKRPLKGWHKRYLCLENGTLSYSKNASDMEKNKLHGSTDIGLSVISIKPSSRRIDIDSDVGIFHLKTKKKDFNLWINALKNHRLARQHQINYGVNQQSLADEYFNEIYIDFSKTKPETVKNDLNFSNDIMKDDLNRLQEKIIKLSSLLKFIEMSSSSSNVIDLEGFKYKKFRRKFHLRKKKNTQSLMIDESVSNQQLNCSLSSSHLSLAEESNKTNDQQQDLDKFLTKKQAMNDFISVANEINTSLRKICKIAQDKKNDVKEEIVLQVKDVSYVDRRRFFTQNQSRYSLDDSSVISVSEYYDAEDEHPSDYDLTASSSEDDESVITEEADNFKTKAIAIVDRRTKLPSIQPSNDISLWSLLCKNIGKDLSKICMPVTINEPLNVLQRLCEELEYCELLDLAATLDDPSQRMLLVAAFAISAYSSSYYRAGHKPFNPLLGETYENVREDKGFRFISEQVKHHPPVSACQAESKNYVFWQDMRVKTKFWGKSMEIIPIGTVNVLLKQFDCHYKWNKIITCVHNLFKGERYVDNYGELTIKDSTGLTCKITFEKSSYWSNKKNEINGYMMNAQNEIVEKIFGKWNESIYCGSRCLWRAGTMPENYELYYGFTRTAIQLNELLEHEKIFLPPTDTRFRPDQRLLEEGKLVEAETIKSELEQAQRDRRKKKEDSGNPEYNPLWFKNEVVDGEEIFVSNNQYWKARENKFSGIEFVKLW